MRRFSLVVVALLLAQHALSLTITNPAFDVRHVEFGTSSYQGITFTPNGDLYMSYGGQYRHYAGAVNLPIGASLPPARTFSGQSSTNIVSSQTGRIYNVNGYEIDKVTGAGTQRWVDCGASHGIAIDPRDGAVFVSSVSSGKVWRIPNPDLSTGVYNTNCVNDLYFDGVLANVGGFDGITIGPDGKLYCAGWTLSKFVIISAYSVATPKGTLISGKDTVVHTPDGISICFGSGESFALVAMTSGSIAKFALSGPNGAPNFVESSIATGVGGYLDFSAVDPKGCIWGTDLGSTNGLYRVTNADGSCGCASPQVPPQPPTGSCPNCSDSKTTAYQGNVAFLESHSSSGNCATLAFN